MHFNIGRELNRCIVNCDTKWRQCRCNYLAKCTKSLQCAQCRALYPPQIAIFSKCTSANCTIVFSKRNLLTSCYTQLTSKLHTSQCSNRCYKAKWWGWGGAILQYAPLELVIVTTGDKASSYSE